MANEGEEFKLFGLDNELSVDAQGWVRLAPYGDHPKSRIATQADGSVKLEKYIQRLDKAAAETMARQFNSPIGKAKRFFSSVEIFRRHPDIAKHQPETVTTLANDKASYGSVTGLEAREDGLYCRPALTDDGASAVERDGLKFISPHWLVKESGEADGATIVSPVKLLSGGLTDRPNIDGGQALANQNDQTESNPMKEIVIGLLALANEAGTADVVKAIDGLKAKAGQLDSANAAKATAETALANERSALATTKTALANERAAHIKTIVDWAVDTGRITEAQRTEHTTALANENEFSAKSEALRTKAPVVKMQSRFGDLGSRKGPAAPVAAQEASRKVLALANERSTKEGIPFRQAWNNVTAENPELARQMEQAPD